MFCVKDEKFYLCTVLDLLSAAAIFVIIRMEMDIIKVCVCYFLSNFYFPLNDSPLKTMKNVIYFI